MYVLINIYMLLPLPHIYVYIHVYIYAVVRYYFKKYLTCCVEACIQQC